eukprot:762016-Pleurochrysis_carterae.AAC.3
MCIFLYMYALDVSIVCEHKERGLRVGVRVLSQVVAHLPCSSAFYDASKAAMCTAYNSEF